MDFFFSGLTGRTALDAEAIHSHHPLVAAYNPHRVITVHRSGQWSSDRGNLGMDGVKISIALQG